MATKQPRTFAERLKHYREQHGWTQTELGAYSGLGQATISLYENGSRENPRGTAINRLAQALGIKVSELISNDAPEGPLPAMATPALNDLARRVEALERHTQAGFRQTKIAIDNLERALRQRPKSQSASPKNQKR